jgi:hypothetical protein
MCQLSRQGPLGRDHREGERGVGGHPAQPEHAGGRSLATAAHHAEQRRAPGVQGADQVAAVIDDQVRAGPRGVERLPDVLVVRVPTQAQPI